MSTTSIQQRNYWLFQDGIYLVTLSVAILYLLMQHNQLCLCTYLRGEWNTIWFCFLFQPKHSTIL